VPHVDGRFLGELGPPLRRWDGSRLLGVIRQDGSLPMTGALQNTAGIINLDKQFAAYFGKIFFRADDGTPKVLIKGYYNGIEIRTGADTDTANLACKYFSASYWQALETTSWLAAKPSIGSIIVLYGYDGVASQEVARVQSGNIPTFNIPLAGNISIIDDRFIQIGKDSDGSLPTPGADYRGKVIRVEGASGVADVLYCCMKKTDNSYAWIQVATG